MNGRRRSAHSWAEVRLRNEVGLLDFARITRLMSFFVDNLDGEPYNVAFPRFVTDFVTVDSRFDAVEEKG